MSLIIFASVFWLLSVVAFVGGHSDIGWYALIISSTYIAASLAKSD
jgi:nitrate reductase NapE component